MVVEIILIMNWDLLKLVGLKEVVILLSLIATIAAIYRYLRGTFYKIAGVDLIGKHAIVTGGASGLGEQTVKELVKLNCQILIADSNSIKAQQCIKNIKKSHPSATVDFEYLDLASKDSIKDFVKRVKFPSLEFLVNNAGVFNMKKERKTVEGFQMDFGINYLGHFYLTYLLWPLLNKAKNFRVVNISSVTHKKKYFTMWGRPELDLDDLNMTKNYNPNEAYARSKLCIVMETYLMGVNLGSQFKGKVVSVHPGIVRTSIMNGFFELGWIGKVFKFISWPFYPLYAFFTKNVKEGNQTTMFALLSQNIENGAYYAECKKDWVNSFVTNLENCEKLWRQSEKLLGIEFDLNRRCEL